MAHHLQPPPLAFLCISGIPTFHHLFFHSSVQLTHEPILKATVEQFFTGPTMIGSASQYDKWNFVLDMLLPLSAEKNPVFVRPEPVAEETTAEKEHGARRMLYEYFLQENLYEGLVGDVDPGFEWVNDNHKKWEKWPQTILIQGSNDTDVDKDVCISITNRLGRKANIFMAKGQPHMFEATSFLEDESTPMDVVREAIEELKDTIRHTFCLGSP